MQHLVKHEPSFSVLEVALAPGEAIIAEAGAMVARSPSVQMEVQLDPRRAGGLLGRLKALIVAVVRKLAGGEAFFVSRVSAPAGGFVWLAPAMSGRIRRVELRGEAMRFSGGAYLASAGDVDLSVRWGGLRAVFAREGPFFVEASGSGALWIASYGAVEELACDGSLLVDSGHLVGFDAALDMKVRSAGGRLLGVAASGEGLACELSGRGRVLVQTRSAGALVDWLAPLLPP